MKSFKESLKETVDKIKSEDEQNFVDKHVVDKKEHPVAGEDQFVTKTKKDKSRVADPEEGEDEAVYEEARKIECPDCGKHYMKGDEHECEFEETVAEEEMSDAQMKKREEIVKSMKKKMASFKDKYGDRAKEVMYATATKMAMKEETEELSEAVSAGKVKLDDGSTAMVSKDEAEMINGLFKQLNSANKKKMQERMMKDKKGFAEILNFAKETM